MTSHNADYAKLSPFRAIFLAGILLKKAVIHNLRLHCAQLCEGVVMGAIW
jgi:hypothetical protein